MRNISACRDPRPLSPPLRQSCAAPARHRQHTCGRHTARARQVLNTAAAGRTLQLNDGYFFGLLERMTKGVPRPRSAHRVPCVLSSSRSSVLRRRRALGAAGSIAVLPDIMVGSHAARGPSTGERAPGRRARRRAGPAEQPRESAAAGAAAGLQSGRAGALAARAAARPVTRGPVHAPGTGQRPARRSRSGSGLPGDARLGACIRHRPEGLQGRRACGARSTGAFCRMRHASELVLALGLPRGCHAGHGEGGCVFGWCSGSRLVALQAGCRISGVRRRAAPAGAVNFTCCHGDFCIACRRPCVAVYCLGEAWSVSVCREVTVAAAVFSTLRLSVVGCMSHRQRIVLGKGDVASCVKLDWHTESMVSKWQSSFCYMITECEILQLKRVCRT